MTSEAQTELLLNTLGSEENPKASIYYLYISTSVSKRFEWVYVTGKMKINSRKLLHNRKKTHHIYSFLSSATHFSGSLSLAPFLFSVCVFISVSASTLLQPKKAKTFQRFSSQLRLAPVFFRQLTGRKVPPSPGFRRRCRQTGGDLRQSESLRKGPEAPPTCPDTGVPAVAVRRGVAV